jgi:hypothetical protein
MSPLLIYRFTSKLKFMANKPLMGFAELTESIQVQSTTGLTFNIKDVESKVASNGNVGYRVKLDNGQVITFFSHTKEGVYQINDLIEAIDDDGNHRVIAGTRITETGSLLPKGAKKGGFWD